MVKALQKGGPAIAVINKVDLLDNFAALEARKKQLEEFGCFDHIVTISAKDGTGCDELFAMLKPYGNEARTISMMTPSPICRRRSLSQSLCARRHCFSCGRGAPRHCRRCRAV